MTTTTTTLFDLNQTATTAAAAALGKDAYTTENMKLESFNAAGHDKTDYPQWEQYFSGSLATYTALKGQLSPSAKAAQQAAAKATTPAKP